jgi:hypothetical protein
MLTNCLFGGKQHSHTIVFLSKIKQIRNLKKIIFLIASNGNAIINDLQIQYFTNEGPMVYGIWSLGVHKNPTISVCLVQSGHDRDLVEM